MEQEMQTEVRYKRLMPFVEAASWLANAVLDRLPFVGQPYQDEPKFDGYLATQE